LRRRESVDHAASRAAAERGIADRIVRVVAYALLPPACGYRRRDLAGPSTNPMQVVLPSVSRAATLQRTGFTFLSGVSSSTLALAADETLGRGSGADAGGGMVAGGPAMGGGDPILSPSVAGGC
jgi:hypothetical protein